MSLCLRSNVHDGDKVVDVDYVVTYLRNNVEEVVMYIVYTMGTMRTMYTMYTNRVHCFRTYVKDKVYIDNKALPDTL